MSVGVLQCSVMNQSKLTWFYSLLWFGCMFFLGQKSLPGAAGTSGTWRGTLPAKTDIQTFKNALSH